MEKHSLYEFEVLKIADGWVYIIYEPNLKPTVKTILRESEEGYETDEEARFAAIGHISLLESGEDKS